MATPSKVPGARRGVLIAGNWKMYKTPAEARALAEEIARGLPASAEPQVALFPPAVALTVVVDALRGSPKRITVGAQNIHFEKEGAFTGEISADMVLAAGAGAALIGHSERRHIFLESDEWIGKKVARALATGLTPYLCVGEKLEEREADRTKDVVGRQLAAGISSITDPASLARVVVAYEPVWAIGTGRTATPEQGEEVHRFIRDQIAGAFAALGAPKARAEETMILYGGSVKPENAAAILAEANIDGLLVGGASLMADSFIRIVRAGA
jgi:triosephosphate isomerase (TIM)